MSVCRRFNFAQTSRRSEGYTLDNPLDGLIVGYHKGDTLMFSSKLRNGFVATDHGLGPP